MHMFGEITSLCVAYSALIQLVLLVLDLLTRDLGYNGYSVESVEDLTKPFVSMYFGAAYMTWLSEYDGR